MMNEDEFRVPRLRKMSVMLPEVLFVRLQDLKLFDNGGIDTYVAQAIAEKLREDGDI